MDPPEECSVILGPVYNCAHTGIRCCTGPWCHSLQVCICPAATKGAGHLDMSRWDMSIDVQVGRLRVIALVRFLNQLIWFAKQLNLSQKAIESAKRSAQEQATAAVTAVSHFSCTFV